MSLARLAWDALMIVAAIAIAIAVWRQAAK